MTPACPLCQSPRALPFFEEKSRVYFACAQCELRFLEPSSRLTAEEERARYLHHSDDITDPGYRRFVTPLCEQILANVRPGASGLDFGAGRGPVLADLLTKAGHPIRLYDPFFHADHESLEQRYDFIVACEVVEHLYEPLAELERLKALLVPDGLLGVMTWLWDETIDFAQWSFRRDPTHVVFYTEGTFRWIGVTLGFSQVSFPTGRVILLRG